MTVTVAVPERPGEAARWITSVDPDTEAATAVLFEFAE